MLSGIITALPTPFLHNKIDFSSLENLIKRQINAGIESLVLFGSTGEGVNIEYDEYVEGIKFVANLLIETKIKLFVGASAFSTTTVIKLSETAKKFGAFGVLISPSPYNKPTQEGILEIYKNVSEFNIPFIAYNIPGRTGVDISDETILKIAKLNNFVALKDSTGDLKRIQSLKAKNSKINLLCGDDNMFLSNMVHGTSGIVSVVSNIIPKTFVKMYNLCVNNNYIESAKIFQEIYPICCSLFLQSNPILIKFALMKLGVFKSDELRSPLIKVSEDKIIDILNNDIQSSERIEGLF